MWTISKNWKIILISSLGPSALSKGAGIGWCMHTPIGPFPQASCLQKFSLSIVNSNIGSLCKSIVNNSCHSLPYNKGRAQSQHASCSYLWFKKIVCIIHDASMRYHCVCTCTCTCDSVHSTYMYQKCNRSHHAPLHPEQELYLLISPSPAVLDETDGGQARSKLLAKRSCDDVVIFRLGPVV